MTSLGMVESFQVLLYLIPELVPVFRDRVLQNVEVCSEFGVSFLFYLYWSILGLFVT